MYEIVLYFESGDVLYLYRKTLELWVSRLGGTVPVPDVICRDGMGWDNEDGSRGRFNRIHDQRCSNYRRPSPDRDC